MRSAIVIRCMTIVALVVSVKGYPNPGIPQTDHNQTAVEPKGAATNDNANYYDEHEDEKDAYLEQESEQTSLREQEQYQQRRQTFYPSFAPYANPPLGHSRPFLYQQEGAYSQRPDIYRQQLTTYDGRYNNFNSRDGRDRSYTNAAAAASTADTHGVLGSGNFGVIRGGTFYNDEGDNYEYDQRQAYNPYYRNNGHGRPSFYVGAANPRPQQHEQFANFRDFADINTPANSAYSEYVVVYANKNSSHHDEPLGQTGRKEPKNIFETLAMLDLEMQQQHAPSTETPIIEKKLSKAKAKLALLLPEKKYKIKKVKHTTTKDLHEPLLALS